MSLLLSTDGSTTRSIEALVGGRVSVNVRCQDAVSGDRLPSWFRGQFEGEGPFLRRVSSLSYKGEVLSDNVVFADTSLLSPELSQNLYDGKLPLGNLIANAETRRVLLRAGSLGPELQEEFRKLADLLADGCPTKEYLIVRGERCWFHVGEVFHSWRIFRHFWPTVEEP